MFLLVSLFLLFVCLFLSFSYHIRVMEGSMHANYVFVLTSVAILWRPNSNAKDYAMQMELPAMGMDSDDDDDFVGNELELTPNVPSAADGNDPDHVNGMKVDRGYVS